MLRVELKKSNKMFPVIQELLKEGKRVRLPVTGTSMYPFLMEERDSVELSYALFSEVKSGDIVLILRENGQYILHRVITKTENCFYIVGDAQQEIEGPLYPNQLIAVVISVWRMKEHIECSNLCWKTLSYVWVKLLPFRYFIMRIYRFILKLKALLLHQKT
jgi:signal peptidase